MSAFTKLFAWFDDGVINNADDVLSISRCRHCDQQRSDVGPAIHRLLFCGRLTDDRIKRWSSSFVLHGNSRYEQIPNIFFRFHYAILLQRMVVDRAS